jgi:nitrate/nitrite transporter NarK
MRWLAVWLILTGIYLAWQLAAPLLLGERWDFTREDLAHLATVPLVQVVALRVVAGVRRSVRASSRR